MASVTVTRDLDAPPEEVRAAIRDVQPFMEAGGFDEVAVDGDTLRLVNGFAIARIELDLAIVDDEDAVLAYEQRDGIFENMYTAYTVEPRDGGCRVEATTDFALDVAVAGQVLDATVIKRQRTRELTAQFDYLESLFED